MRPFSGKFHRAGFYEKTEKFTKEIYLQPSLHFAGESAVVVHHIDRTARIRPVKNDAEKMNSEVTDALLFRFFAGQTTNEETDRISAWLSADPRANQQRLNRAHDLYVLSIMSEPDTGSESRPGLKMRLLRGGVLRRIAGIAAAVLVALGGSYLFHVQRTERLCERLTTIEAPAGQHIRIALNDGTTVELNARSRLTYPALFTRRERRVQLEGEARFDVHHDARQPFVVETFACDVEVRGTKFNVLADETSHRFSTALFEGCVAVRSRTTGEQLLMDPNTVVDLRDGHLHLGPLTDADDYLWTEGIVSFGGDTFREIVAKFEKYYGVRIVIERATPPEIRYQRLKVRISEGVDHALRVLQRASDFTYEYDDGSNRILIR